MPDQHFTVPAPDLSPETPVSIHRPDDKPAAAHHGAGDARLAARQRSERDRAGRAPGGSGRSYAFRRH